MTDVLVVSHLLSRASGAFVLAQAAAAGRHLDVTVLAARKPWEPPSGQRHDVRYLVLPRNLAPAASAALSALTLDVALRLHRLPRPRLVHAHAPLPDAAAVRRLGAPVVVTSHAARPGDFFGHVQRQAAAAVRPAARLVVPNSRLVETTAEALGYPAERIAVVPNAVGDGFVPRKVPPRDHADLLFVGNLVPVKRVGLALDVLRALRAKGIDARLTVVGDGPERDRLASTDLPVRHHRRLPNDRLAEVLAAHDVLLSTSLWESFGVAMAEALCVGLPVVATPTDGARELLDGMSGCVLTTIEPDPAVIAEDVTRALDDGRHDAAARARQARGRWGADAVGARLVELYREVLGEA